GRAVPLADARRARHHHAPTFVGHLAPDATRTPRLPVQLRADRPLGPSRQDALLAPGPRTWDPRPSPTGCGPSAAGPHPPPRLNLARAISPSTSRPEERRDSGQSTGLSARLAQCCIAQPPTTSAAPTSASRWMLRPVK